MPRALFRPLRTVMVPLAIASLCGCTALGPTAEDADTVAAAFTAAIAESDGAAACALLNERALDDVEAQTGSDCADGIVTLGLPSGGTLRSTEVFGRSALVTLDTDSVFLTAGDPIWQIRAAGCEAREDAPFDCTIDGS